MSVGDIQAAINIRHPFVNHILHFTFKKLVAASSYPKMSDGSVGIEYPCCGESAFPSSVEGLYKYSICIRPDVCREVHTLVREELPDRANVRLGIDTDQNECHVEVLVVSTQFDQVWKFSYARRAVCSPNVHHYGFSL